MEVNGDHGDLLTVAGRWWLPLAVVVAAAAICSAVCSPWLAFSLLCLCGICVNGARLLSSAALRRLKRRHQPLLASRVAEEPGRTAVMVMLALVMVQALVSSEALWLVLTHWHLVLVAPMLGLVLHLIGSPKAMLEDALHYSHISYAQGAAWGFYLSYLSKSLDHSAATGQEDLASFKDRMDDYLTSNKLNNSERSFTCKNRLLVLVPMKHELFLSERSLSDHDSSIEEEGKLTGVQIDGRWYGQTKVYRIKDGEMVYRAAMEEATPIRTAALAVNDANANFDLLHFEEFTRCFLDQLQNILHMKRLIREQVDLVPVYDFDGIRAAVLRRIRDLERLEQGTAGQDIIDRMMATGSVAATARR